MICAFWCAYGLIIAALHTVNSLLLLLATLND